jgi:hypothetical protein
MIMNSLSGRRRRAWARNWRWLGWIRSGPTFTSQNKTSAGSRHANTSKNPANVPPLASLTASKMSAADGAAPVAAMVRNAGAGNHWRRTNPPNAETQAPCQPAVLSSATTASSAQQGRPATATIGLRSQIRGSPAGSGSPDHRLAAIAAS